MKALLIVALMGMAQPHQVVYDSMEQCIASKAVVEKQEMVEGAACVPHQNIAKQLEDPMKIILGFMKQIKQRHKCEDMQQMILLEECLKKPIKLPQTMHEPSKLPEPSWPKGVKVPCRCDILAIPYDLCLKGIGREECFKTEKPKQSSEKPKYNIPKNHWDPMIPKQSSQAPKYTLPKVVDPKNFKLERVAEAPKTVPFVDPDKNISEAPKKQAARVYPQPHAGWGDYSEKKWKW